MQNPLQKPKRTRPSPYPIVVKCIVEVLADYNNKDIHKIRDYAISQNVLFETRLYNSYRYSEDRYEVRELPAFHVYTNGLYMRTFYAKTRPLQHIQECIEEYKGALERRRQRREYWNNIIPRTIGAIVKAVRKVFHRKTRLERALDEKRLERIREERAHRQIEWS
jgi:hypothetical protein